MRDHNCVLVVRHGRSDWHGQHRFIGQTDVPLNVEGKADAERVAAEVAKFMPCYLVSSDLLRARDTAAAISERCNLPINLDERLREENLGGWAGLSREEVKNKFSGEYERWCNGDIFEAHGEREGLNSTARRAHLAVNEAIFNSLGRAIVVVTHLNTSLVIIASMLPQDKFFHVPRPHCGTLHLYAHSSWPLFLDVRDRFQQLPISADRCRHHMAD